MMQEDVSYNLPFFLLIDCLGLTEQTSRYKASTDGHSFVTNFEVLDFDMKLPFVFSLVI